MARGRVYRPGSRDPRFRQTTREGRMNEARWAWLQTICGTMNIFRYAETEFEEPGETILLMIPRGKAKPATINLSAMTEEELQLTRQFFDRAFALVEPTVKLRDKAAREAFDAGDDSFARNYRQTPRLIIREGAIGPHPKSLLGGPEDLSTGDEDDGGPEGDLRGDGDGMADVQPPDRRTQDDEPQADQPEGVPPVG